jgi:hypothetical protein
MRIRKCKSEWTYLKMLEGIKSKNMSPGRREAHGTQQLIHLQLHSGAA